MDLAEKLRKCIKEDEEEEDEEENEMEDDYEREAIADLMQSMNSVSSMNEQISSATQSKRKAGPVVSGELVSILSRKKPKSNKKLEAKYKEMLDKPVPTRVSGDLFPGGAGMAFVDANAVNHGGTEACEEVDIPASLERAAIQTGKMQKSLYQTQRYNFEKKRGKRQHKEGPSRTKRKKRPRKRVSKPGTIFSSTEYSENSEPTATSSTAKRNNKKKKRKNRRRSSATTTEPSAVTEDEFFVDEDDEEGDVVDGGEESVSNIEEDEEGRGDLGIAERKSSDIANALRAAIIEREISMRGSDSSSGRGSKESENGEIILKGQASRTSSEDEGHHIIGDYGRHVAPAANINNQLSISSREAVLGRDGDPRTCFLCLFGNVQHDSMVSTKIQALWDILASNYFSTTDTEGLAAAAYAYYLEEIYSEGVSNGLDLPMWSEKGMYIHITEHMGDPRIFLGESIKDLTMMRRVLKTMAFREDDNGQCSPDIKVVSEIRMLTKQIRDLYMSDPQVMFGYCDAFKADATSMHRLVHMSRITIQDETRIHSSRGTFS